jgi:hypothetical protein
MRGYRAQGGSGSERAKRRGCLSALGVELGNLIHELLQGTNVQ